MKLFGLYTMRDIPRLRANHRLFAERNGMDYREYYIRNFYEKWALVYWLLETHPDETLVFIDAFSYFVSPDFALDCRDPLIVQEVNGVPMDNFFVVKSCSETRRIFHEVQRISGGRFIAESVFLFEPPLPKGMAKPYGFSDANGRRFNLDLGFSDRGKYHKTTELPLGFDARDGLSRSLVSSRIDDIVVAKYGGNVWDSQFWTVAEILCHHCPETRPWSADGTLEVVNPGRQKAIITLSSSEQGTPIPEYAAVSEGNFRRYAEQRNVTLYLYKGIPREYAGLHSTWTKPYLLLRHLQNHEYLSWVDGDVLLSGGFDLPEGQDIIVYSDPGAWLFNAGFFTLKQTEAVRSYLRAVIARCEAIEDRSSLYINGSDQTQFIEEFVKHFPDYLPRSNLVANIPLVLDSLRKRAPGVWHFMGLNPPSIRAIVMDYYEKFVVNRSLE